jgi:hypothetical protein
LDRQEIVAYLAGVFDGEGSITISKAPPRGRYKSPIYRLMVQISNTNLEVLRIAQNQYGGCVGGPFLRGLRWRPYYRWKLDDENSMNFLRDIEPYTQIKHGHIQTALEFREQVLTSHTESLGKGYGSKPMSNDEVDVREALYQRMRHLSESG